MNQQIQILTAPEARKLSSYLRSEKSTPETLNFNQLKGYLFSICCTPALLQPSFWLPEVFGGEMPVFESEQDFWVIDAVMKLYNQINGEVLEGRAKLPANCKVTDDVGGNFQPGSVLHEWSWGFELGLEHTMGFWDNFPLPEELEEEIECYWMLLGFFADEQRARAAKIEDGVSPPFPVMLKVVREQMPGLLKDYAVIGRMLYEVTLEDLGDEVEQLPLGLQEEKAVDNTVIPLYKDALQGNGDDLIDAAYAEETSPAEKIALAKQALRENPGCVDAYLLLADWAAESDQERKQYYEQALAAGEKALGESYFVENAGHFWGLWETRPYMMALAGAAETSARLKDKPLAMALYEKGLYLNPSDNQGLRYFLLTLYLEQSWLDKAESLIADYSDDSSAFFRYSQLLIAYIREGDTPNTRSLKKDAKEYNRYVPKLLAGQTKIPKILPEYYGIGDKNEAIIYADGNRKLWRQVMGSIPWLLKK